MPTRVELCKADQVAPGSALRVEAAGLTVAVFNLDGTFYVTDDACTHGPGSLSEGFIDGDVIECNFHNGQFDIKTGEVVSPPCMDIVLYYAPITCAMAPYITLTEANAKFEVKSLNLRKGQQNSPEYLKLNPKHKVPLLVIDGQILSESTAIQVWIARNFPQAKLLPADP